jgi:CBS domain-containing protein
MVGEITTFLQTHPPFNLLTSEQVRTIAASIESREVGPGEDILTPQDASVEYLYIVHQGSVEMLQEDEASIVTFFDTLREGDIFGHTALVRGQSPQVIIRSREKTRLSLLPAETFFRLRCENLEFARFVDSLAIEQTIMVSQSRTTSTTSGLQVRLGDILQRKLVSVAPEMTVRDAARLMKQNGVRYLIVDTNPTGIVTDHDLRNRVILEGLSYETTVGEVMTSPLLTLPADSLVFEGLMMLLENRMRHLPVTENGQIIGVVTHIDILRQQSHDPLFLPRQLMRARSIGDLRQYTEQVTETVGSMLHTDSRMQDIGRVVAVAHGALLDHLIHDAEANLGPPPCPYAWLVLGSEGRYEQTLRTDQDNALVYADDAPQGAEEYFTRLAERVVGQLVECGFPRCPGDIMATNPRWRKPLQTWRSYFSDWIHVPDEEALMRASIFFDYRRVAGTLDVEQALRPIILGATKNRIFLSRLAKNALRQSPPLGSFFRDFSVERDAAGRDAIDMKMRGTALIVDLARLFALEAGCSATNTITRLHLSVPRSDLSEVGADELEAAFERISLLRLRHQYHQIQRGEEPTNLVPVSSLTTLERRQLKTALRAIQEIQQSAASLFGTSWIM